MLFLSDSESEKDLECETDQLIFDALSTASTSTKSSPKKARKNQKTIEEKTKLKEERIRLKEEKLKLQEEKAKLREEKKKANELLKRQKPGECIKYINVLFDSDLTNCKFGGELLVAVQTAEIQYKVEKLKISNAVLWMRELEDGSKKYENYLLVIWTWKELVNSLLADAIDDNLREYSRAYPAFKITLVVYGIEEYFSLQKIRKNRQLKANHLGIENAEKTKKKDQLSDVPFFSRIDVETTLVKLQLLHDLQHRFVESGQELGLFVTQFSKSLAELPFKIDRNRKYESTDWYATADSRETVRVDNNGNGLLRLWQQQICQFPNVGFDVAQAIVSEYNSPSALIEAYDRCSNRREAELLLQHIPVRRAQGPLTSCRRIGPELSKKIFAFLNNLDGNVSLSQE